MKNSLIIRVYGGALSPPHTQVTSACTSRPAAVDAHLHNSLITMPLPPCTPPPQLHYYLPRSQLTRAEALGTGPGALTRHFQTGSVYAPSANRQHRARQHRARLYGGNILAVSVAQQVQQVRAVCSAPLRIYPVPRLLYCGQNFTIYEVGSETFKNELCPEFNLYLNVLLHARYKSPAPYGMLIQTWSLPLTLTAPPSSLSLIPS